MGELIDSLTLLLCPRMDVKSRKYTQLCLEGREEKEKKAIIFCYNELEIVMKICRM